MNPRLTRIGDCETVQLAQRSRSGMIEFTASMEHGLPFPIRRVYYLDQAPEGGLRGDHAHLALFQLLVAVEGTLEVRLNDGHLSRIVTLNRPDLGLLIVPGVWKELLALSSDALCLVLASELFSEADYIRSWDEFVNFKQAK
jgi:dTDP-4-dehydrorhamnose 3,5-epimerase-like enzyme